MTTIRIRPVAQRIVAIGLAAFTMVFVEIGAFPSTAVGLGGTDLKPMQACSTKFENGEEAASRSLLDSCDDAKPVQALSFPGRVIDYETGTPIRDVPILVDRLLPGANARAIPSWAGRSAIRTDADGRFQLVFPPEQVAERGLMITLRVRHPGFIPRESWPINLAAIVRRQALGDKPFFETIRLEKGVEYTSANRHTDRQARGRCAVFLRELDVGEE